MDNEINMFQKRPSIELKEEKEKENENGDYVQTSPMTNDSHSVSSNKPMLNHNSIETKEIETNYNKPQKTRPSTTPSPIYNDNDAQIIIEKTSSCSCFAFFGKSKKKEK